MGGGGRVGVRRCKKNKWLAMFEDFLHFSRMKLFRIDLGKVSKSLYAGLDVDRVKEALIRMIEI